MEHVMATLQVELQGQRQLGWSGGRPVGAVRIQVAEVEQASVTGLQFPGLQKNDGVLQPGIEQVLETGGRAGLLADQQIHRADVAHPDRPAFVARQLLQYTSWFKGFHRTRDQLCWPLGADTGDQTQPSRRVELSGGRMVDQG